ncbi:hypothetical protein EB796_020515 [Bugula neritina]|uniref:Uncharacterized protein n=1 Tax=Bugula neritina TaxID=10212 RepID=A0A7J7J4S1_BUGNE|nr:hypothetical protein EB796_020515 [Bugula neritina]
MLGLVTVKEHRLNMNGHALLLTAIFMISFISSASSLWTASNDRCRRHCYARGKLKYDNYILGYCFCR